MMPFAFIQNLGMTELIIVAFISLLVFGNRLPSVMRSLGKSVTEFKKGVLRLTLPKRPGSQSRRKKTPVT